MQKPIRTIKIILSLYILVIPILRYYELPGGSNLYLLIANVLVLFIIAQRRYIVLSSNLVKGAAIFVCWALLVSFVAYNFASYKGLIESTSLNNLIVLCDSIFIAVACAYEGINYDDFITLYKWICYILVIYIILQLLGIQIPGFTMTGKISFLDVKSVYQVRGNNWGVYPSGLFTRYSSLFIEPSHFSQYLTPFLCFSLFGYKNIIKRNIIQAIIVSFVMIMSISGTSIAIAIIIWLYFMFTEIKEITLTKIFLIALLFIVLIVAVILGAQNAGISSMILGMSDSSSNKVSDRILRGFLVFLQLPLFNKLFGIGYQCVYPASVQHGIEIGYSVANNVREYVNDIASVLLSFGLLGSVPVIILIRRCFQGANKGEIAIYIGCLAIFFSECTFGVIWLLLICTCICAHKERLENCD